MFDLALAAEHSKPEAATLKHIITEQTSRQRPTKSNCDNRTRIQTKSVHSARFPRCQSQCACADECTVELKEQ